MTWLGVRTANDVYDYDWMQTSHILAIPNAVSEKVFDGFEFLLTITSHWLLYILFLNVNKGEVKTSHVFKFSLTVEKLWFDYKHIWQILPKGWNKTFEPLNINYYLAVVCCLICSTNVIKATLKLTYLSLMQKIYFKVHNKIVVSMKQNEAAWTNIWQKYNITVYLSIILQFN